jgi:hypothetical protein
MILLSPLRKRLVSCIPLAVGALLVSVLAGCGHESTSAPDTASNTGTAPDASAFRSEAFGQDRASQNGTSQDRVMPADSTQVAADPDSRQNTAAAVLDEEPSAQNPGPASSALAQAAEDARTTSLPDSSKPEPQDAADRPSTPRAQRALDIAERPGLRENTLRPARSPQASSTPSTDKPAVPDKPTVRESTPVGQPAAVGPAADAAPYDPDALFVDWPKPECVLFITGRQHGYIEPCGCTGLTNQKGGLVRRYSLKRQLEERGWTVVPLDVGNQVRRFGRQPEIKFQMTIEGLRRMGYEAIGFGPDDMRLSVGELVALTASDGQTPSPFVCANTAVIDPALTPRFQVIQAGGRKIGVTGVLGADEQAKISSDEIVKSDAVEALRNVWAELQQQQCDLTVLLAHTSLENSTALAQKFPEFDVVVTAGGAGEPTYEAEKIPETDAVMVQVGTKGMYVGVIGVFDDPQQPLRYQRVPLDARFPDSREMLQLLGSYQEQLKTAGLEGLGIRAIPVPGKRRYVGSEACADCHGDEYDIWEDTPHSHALDSLIHPGERSEVPRHFDPECISCHVSLSENPVSWRRLPACEGVSDRF